MSIFSKINWRYTIGEILIVILGISIAFGLNNWAANRKDDKQKVRYLQNLQKDLEADIVSLDSCIQDLNTRIESISEIFVSFRQPELRPSVLPKIFQLPFPIEFRPRNITYQTLINSGDFNLIDDFELKTMIQEHYLNYGHILEIYERQNILVEKYLGKFFMEEMDYQAIYQGDYSFMNDKLFGNMINAMNQTYKIKLEASETGKQDCKKLIELIDANFE